jgi:serine protease
MRRFRQWLWVFGLCVGSAVGANAAEWNPVRTHSIQLGPEAGRVIVGFRPAAASGFAQIQSLKSSEMQTSAVDVSDLAARTGVAMTHSRQIASRMHVMFLQQTLYGADVNTALAALRADPAVEYADVDQRRYPHAMPNDPFFVATTNASGQWYMQPPDTSSATSDWAATDAISAWNITTGSRAIVIADVDTGVRFDHPDLLQAGPAGRLLPGYDFVGQDFNRTSPFAGNGMFLTANDGNGRDADPSDPGDWIDSTDLQNPQFPAAACGSATGGPVDSSWHGTRVSGVLGAVTNNSTGIAGMTWTPWLLPVRALGKCGGYDSDILAGIQWAAGITVTGVPNNPYPASIINLSLGATGACPTSYKNVINTLTTMGVLVVASAGNGGAGVDSPGNCPGVLGVAGVRNVGTKVGYSSFGAEVGVAAPAGNCVNTTGPCLRSIDTTTNAGLTVPAANTYTNQLNPNLGTSFSAPIVAGIAALMKAVNPNLTPGELIARIEASASPFPPPGALPVCNINVPSPDPNNGQCACMGSGLCGSGLVNAFSAVKAAQNPIAAVALPASVATGSNAVYDATGSATACGRRVVTYAWTAGGGVIIASGANAAKVTATAGSTTGILTLVVTDDQGGTDTANVTVNTNSAVSTAPTTATIGTCPAAMAFSPVSVGAFALTAVTISLKNPNVFASSQVGFTDTLPTGVTVANSPAPATSCIGGNGSTLSLSSSANSVTLAGANLGIGAGCTVTFSVSGATAGTYVNSVTTSAATIGPGGPDTAAATALLTVTPPTTPTVTEAFSPASVAPNAASTLTITLTNPNAFALTQGALVDSLPAGLTVAASPAAATSCTGSAVSITNTASSATLSGATVPASGSCTVTLSVTSATAGTYTNSIAANAFTTTPAGGNATAASATLAVAAPSSSGGGSGALTWLDLLFASGLLIAGRLRSHRRRLALQWVDE